MMVDPAEFDSLGAALNSAVERHAQHTCLIEANRDRENHRLTYARFGAAMRPVARAIQDRGFFPEHRAAVLMTNQSRWLVGAHAVFYSGGILVPLDYKLTATEHIQLLNHSRARLLLVEYPIWRALMSEPEFDQLRIDTVVVSEAPVDAEIGQAVRWESCDTSAQPQFAPRQRQDVACIVYSSGTGGRPKGCMLTHDGYLQQVGSLMTLFHFAPGDRYLSILPTNHAIDFMVGFIGPFLCGATVVHLRTLRPEYIKAAFAKFRISYISVVPMLLKGLETTLRERFKQLDPIRRAVLNAKIGLNRKLTANRPRPTISRLLLSQVHRALGGQLKTMFVGGAFTEPATLQFFYDLGLPVANGYGLTEAGTAVTLNNLQPFRSDTVGTPLPGAEVRIIDPGADGVGEVAVRSPTLMRGYLDDPEQTAEVLREGWLFTGDLGCIDNSGHLQLRGRKKNMIVTAGGKNIYPEDIEAAFDGLPVKEFCVFAANYIWPRAELGDEQLLAVINPGPGSTGLDNAARNELVARNRRLLDFKRVHGYVIWSHDFPRTASMKIKRHPLAHAIGEHLNRDEAVVQL